MKDCRVTGLENDTTERAILTKAIDRLLLKAFP